VGSVYLRLGRIPEALENLNTSYAMNPGDQAAIALAEAFRLERKYPEAIDFAQRAVKSNPKEALYWLELGDIYAEFGRNKLNASVAYSRATTTEQDRLRTTPKSGPGWMILALCRAKAGERETALALIEKAESLHADDMDSQLAKVRALELAGQPDRAWAAMARCLQRGPTIFQFESMPDLQRVRATPEFKKLLSTNLSDG
jgi:tetratricopeptide (TPR) repeat protein